MFTLDPLYIYLSRCCIGVLFGLACYHKLANFGVFRAVFADYRIVPSNLLGIAAVLIVATELGVSVLSFLPALASIAMLVAAILLVAYALAIGLNLLRGRRDIDCGCTGPARRQLLSAWLLLRNLILFAVALTGSATSTGRIFGTADFALLALALAGVAALYAATNQLMANAPRLDALDSLMDAS